MIISQNHKRAKNQQLFVILFIVWGVSCSPKPTSEPKVKGLVPDQETAIKIAEAIWLPLYGEQIYDQKPFLAHFANGHWYVTGYNTVVDPSCQSKVTPLS